MKRMLIVLLTLTANVHAATPNIVFVLFDDMGWGQPQSYGPESALRTPNLDRLAQQGMRFTDAHSGAAVCTPTRYGLLTGRYPSRIGQFGVLTTFSQPIIPTNRMTVASLLKQHGYHTACIGKWHMRSDPRGFETYAITRGQGSYFNPDLEVPGGTHKRFTGYYADVYTDLSLNWLEQRDKSKPFALCVHYKGPHNPYDYPERWAKLLDGVTVPEPPTLHEDVEKTSPLLKARLPQQMARNKSYYERYKGDKEPRMGPAGDDAKSQASAAYQHMLHKYIRCVAALDENIQRLLDQLAAEGIMDSTLIIYTSDQGYWLGQHGLYDKRLILEESLKMPLIVRYPKEIKAGTVDNHLCSNVDFAPTLLDYAGVAAPTAMQGCSLRPLLQGKAPSDWRQTIWYAYCAGPPHWGIRTEQYTLVRFPGTENSEFYDLKKDPLQQRSLHADPKYAGPIEITSCIVVGKCDSCVNSSWIWQRMARVFTALQTQKERQAAHLLGPGGILSHGPRLSSASRGLPG